jgi:hypothetical protein
MPANHLIFELRTGRDTENTPETATQLFATLPKLRNKPWHKILNQDEHLSFEILSLNQTIYFLAYVPERLAEYVKSLLQASYPEIDISLLNHDPLDHFVAAFYQIEENNYAENQSQFLSFGHLKLTKPSYLPLKDYRDFTDIDPIATILSTLSKAGPYDKIAIQYVVDKSNIKISVPAANPLTTTGETPQPNPEDQSLIKKKQKSSTLKTNIRLVVSSNFQDRAEIILENLTTAFQSMTQSDSNSLKLEKSRVIKSRFIEQLKNRNFTTHGNALLSLEELATLYHLPNKKLAGIPNIAWGKNLLGEPPENLPVINQNTPKKEKQEINPYAKTSYKNQETIYGLKREDRRRHMYVIGKNWNW